MWAHARRPVVIVATGLMVAGAAARPGPACSMSAGSMSRGARTGRAQCIVRTSGLSPRDNRALARRVGGRGASPPRSVHRASRCLGRPPDRHDQRDGTFTDRVDRARLRSNARGVRRHGSRSAACPDFRSSTRRPRGSTLWERRRCGRRAGAVRLAGPPVEGAASGRGRTGGAGAGVDGWTPGPVRAAGGLRGEGPRLGRSCAGSSERTGGSAWSTSAPRARPR